MARIQPVSYPFNEMATHLLVYVHGFTTDSETCTINYVLTNDVGKQLFSDSYILTNEEFLGWGQDNSYLDELAATRIPVTIISDPEVPVIE